MSRGLYLAVGVAIYLIFFVTFLYLIAFVGNLPLVPRTVDSGPAAMTGTALAVDVALIALFAVQHSVMARAGFKKAWTRIVPHPLERSVYVLCASLALIVLFAFWRPILQPVWALSSGFGADLLWALFAIGWGVVLLSTFLIDHFDLFGLRQVYAHLRGHEVAEPGFRTPFFYRAVRHPIYAGFFLAFWAIPTMTLGHLVLALGMSAYMLIGIRYEERDLVTVFGDTYRRYRATTGMLVPGIGRAHR